MIWKTFLAIVKALGNTSVWLLLSPIWIFIVLFKIANDIEYRVSNIPQKIRKALK